MERLNFKDDATANTWELSIHLARYGLVANLCKGKRVLDLACGQGYGAFLMATKWQAASVHAVDISEEALSAGQALFPDPRILWEKLNLDTFDERCFENKFDLIVSLETVEHLQNPERFLKVLSTLLAPGGTLCVSWPNDEWYYGQGVTYNPYHMHVWNFEQFCQMAEPILGPAKGYFLGSPIKGICTVPISRETAVTENVGPAQSSLKTIEHCTKTDSILFSPDPLEAPSKNSSLYFLGLWQAGNMHESEPLLSSVAWTPVSPDIRLHISTIRPSRSLTEGKPVLVLVVEERGSRFDYTAIQIEKFLKPSYDVQVMYASDYPDAGSLFYNAIWVKEATMVHVFCSDFLFHAFSSTSDVGTFAATLNGANISAYLNRFSATVFTTSVTEFDKHDIANLASRDSFLWMIDAYSAQSQKAFTSYSAHHHCAPDVIIETPGDIDLLKAHSLDRFENRRAEVVVGWLDEGNLLHLDSPTVETKRNGITQALAILREEGRKISEIVIDSTFESLSPNEKSLTFASMDLYLCASTSEQEQRRIPEAMACGVPIGGIRTELTGRLLGKEQKEFLLNDYTPEAWASSLRRLFTQPDILKLLSEENLSQSKERSWPSIGIHWASFFSLAATRLDSRSIQRRRSFLAEKNTLTAFQITTKSPQKEKPVLTLIADVPNWAYCNISQNIRKYLSHIYDIQILYVVDYPDWIALLHDVIWNRKAAIVHVFWREYLFEALTSDIGKAVTDKFDVDNGVFLRKLSKTVFTTSVYDHLNLDDASIKLRQNFFGLVDSFIVSSNKLFDIYCKAYSVKPDFVIEDGVDLDLFKPIDLARLEKDDGDLVVGWAGNSHWCKDANYDPKGFHTIVKPAIELLQSEGLKVRAEFADASVTRIPRSEMPLFYSKLDVYICASEIEGTPNPVLEAMACGVPIVSTDVGIVPQVFGPRQREFILKERTPEDLAQLLRTILAKKTLLKSCSEENLARIQTWSWKDKMSRWIAFFALASSRLDELSSKRRELHYSRTANSEIMYGKLKTNTEVQPLYSEIDRLTSIVARQERLLHSKSQEVEVLRRRITGLHENSMDPALP
jgi:glycosyltransferase involved in cell wall biosynthesis/SAM-dependent methyltransferase